MQTLFLSWPPFSGEAEKELIINFLEPEPINYRVKCLDLMGTWAWCELSRCSGKSGCWDLPRHSTECSSRLEQGARVLPVFFFFSSFFASGTKLPHLTFSIWPLPRGEIARVSQRGCHTSRILLSFNLHGPFSPWWCTWIRNEDIAQLRGFLRWLLRYCGYFCATPRFWCIMDMDIEFIASAWCFDILTAQRRKSSPPATGNSPSCLQ